MSPIHAPNTPPCVVCTAGRGSSVSASSPAEAAGGPFTGFPTPYRRAQQGAGAVCACTVPAWTPVGLAQGEIHCGCTPWLRGSPSGLCSLKLRLFNVLSLSKIPNTTIAAAKEWTNAGARLAGFPEMAPPAAVTRGRLLGCVGPRSHQGRCLLGFYFLFPIPFHSCQIHLLHSSLGIASQTQGLSLVLIFWTAGLLTC